MKKEIQMILAIESSCDETSVAVVKNGNEILSNIVASQIKSHERFGGVVPEVASRHHVEQITWCIEAALSEAEVTYADIDAVAVTQGPGLVGALLIGVTAAKAIAYAHNLPLIPVNHMAGHIYAANFVEPLKFPLLSLLVSGGHTELVYMKSAYEFEIIGETRDDAVGEAYDKVGRILGLSYPSGKPMDELAHKGQDTYHLPRAMLKETNFDFSLSGLKSAVINMVHNAKQRDEMIVPENLAASFQASVIEVLVTKTMRALADYPAEQLVIAGGVAANRGLREAMQQAIKENQPNVECIFPSLSLCGDNGAMIGAAAYAKIKAEGIPTGNDYQLNALPSLGFEHI